MEGFVKQLGLFVMAIVLITLTPVVYADTRSVNDATQVTGPTEGPQTTSPDSEDSQIEAASVLTSTPKPKRGLLRAGIITFSAGYVAAVGNGIYWIARGIPELGAYYFIPIAGPAIASGMLFGASNNEWLGPFFVLMGIPGLAFTAAQIVGVSLFTVALVKPQQHQKRKDYSSRYGDKPAPILTAVPVGPQGSHGISLSLRF
jgi:hypothetical protein